MKINTRISFAKQLIIYLVIALIVVFFFISLILTNSVQQFISNNAYNQAQTIADNVQTIFEREITKIENIPNQINSVYGRPSYLNASFLPEKILKSYNSLTGCTVYYAPNDLPGRNFISSVAIKDDQGHICTRASGSLKLFSPAKIIRKNPQNGYWTYTEVNHISSISYHHPIYNKHKEKRGLLVLDFTLKTITDLLCDYKLYQSGYLFIVNKQGDYIAHPEIHSPDYKNILKNTIYQDSSSLSLSRKIINGETGCSSFFNRKKKYFIYYTPIHDTNWRLGLTCLYSEILDSSNKLYLLIFLCLGIGFLFLFIGMVNIVHRLSNPLKQLAYTARQIAHGRFDVVIPKQNSNHEINELYNSFRYMQQSLINYIERLKVSTAAREQINAEITFAHRIQQRFIPHPIQLPPNIGFAAELRQSREVGGDLYEYFLSGNNLYFAIGDVAGKGIPAAFYMASVSKLFKYVAGNYSSTATICNIINKYMCDDIIEDDMYITMFIGILDINTGIIKYTNAGHPYPLIVHEDGIANFLCKHPETPIGVLNNRCFTEHTYTLHKNTSILLYTDGITDAENASGQFYGKERMIKCIQNAPGKTPDKLIHTILENVSQHIGNGNQSDDLTLLGIYYKGIPDAEKQLTVHL